VALIRKLGGKELYGNRNAVSVPLREDERLLCKQEVSGYFVCERNRDIYLIQLATYQILAIVILACVGMTLIEGKLSYLRITARSLHFAPSASLRTPHFGRDDTGGFV